MKIKKELIEKIKKPSKSSMIFFTREFSIPPNGGVANSIYEMATSYNNLYNEVPIIVSENDSANYEIKDYKFLIHIKHPQSKYRPREINLNIYADHLIYILKAFEINIIHSKFISRHLYYSFALQKLGIKFTYILASFYPDETLEFLSRKENTFLKKVYLIAQYLLQLKIEKKLIRSFSKIFVLSKMRKKELNDKYKKSAEFIHPGIRVPEIYNFEKKNKIPKHLLIHCRHEARKNIDGFLKELLRNKKFYESFKVKIIGHGPETIFLKNFVEKNNLESIISFYGYQKNFNKFYLWADLLIFPSLQEGFGQVVLESIARKTPVICYGDVNAPFNEIIKNGVNGFLVEHKRQDSITEVMKYLIANNKYKKLIQNINQEKFVSWDVFLKKIING